MRAHATMSKHYDTLDALDTRGANDIADIYALVVGEAIDADDLCGVITTGPLARQSPKRSSLIEHTSSRDSDSTGE